MKSANTIAGQTIKSSGITTDVNIGIAIVILYHNSEHCFGTKKSYKIFINFNIKTLAAVLGIPLTISTLTTLIGILSTGGHVVYDTYGITSDGIGTIKSTPSKRLMDRCAVIAEILQGVDHNILITNLGRKIVQTLVDCMGWADEYEKKRKIAKILFSSGHREKFKECHQAITQDLSDIAHTMAITSYHPDNEINIENKEIKLGRSKEFLALEYFN